MTDLEKIIAHMNQSQRAQTYDDIAKGAKVDRQYVSKLVSLGLSSGELDGFKRIKMGTTKAAIAGKFKRKTPA